MLNLNGKLKELETKNERVRIGLVGAGRMGTGMISQASLMKGITISMVCDKFLDRAVKAYEAAGILKNKISVSESEEKAERAIESGMVAATSDARTVARTPCIDVVIDATGIPDVGASVGLEAIINRKHMVMMNAEADATFGPILKKLANSAGVVYTGAAGDEPGAAKEIYDFADALGFEIVAAGKGKNNPLDKYATPESLSSAAMERGLSPKMYASFVDGTKSMVEMTQLANATNLLPDVRGMHGPTASVKDLPKVFSLKKQGGILNVSGVVDFVIGIAPGVFVVFTCDRELLKEDLKFFGMGLGPNYVLYRPYHLCHMETILSAARAAIFKEPTVAPLDKPRTVVMTIAKRNLRRGESLDGIGGSTVYGLIERADVSREENALPIGLSESVKLIEDVSKEGVIRKDSVQLDEDSPAVQLVRMQDRLLG